MLTSLYIFPSCLISISLLKDNFLCLIRHFPLANVVDFATIANNNENHPTIKIAIFIKYLL